MTRRATINDVAKAAAVGKVTVSYVLNGRGTENGISTETAKRIQEAAKQLNYRPNTVARMLAGNRSDSIAVVFQHAYYFSTTSTFTNEAMRGVCEQCTELGLDLLLHTKPTQDPVAEANALSDGRVDGVLMLRDAGDPTLTELISRNFPVVLFFSRADSPDVSFVDCDNFTGGKIAANHLLSLGHRRMAMMVGPKNSVDSADRYHGFRSALEIEPATCSTMEELAELLSRPDRPTALFVWSDDVAFGCYQIVRDLGLRIPQDLSIIGFDSTPACDRFDPPLTSVRQPIAQMARKATQILTAMVRGEDSAIQQIVFPPHLDVRGSTSMLQS